MKVKQEPEEIGHTEITITKYPKGFETGKRQREPKKGTQVEFLSGVIKSKKIRRATIRTAT
jgi:hypothetical protein